MATKTIMALALLAFAACAAASDVVAVVHLVPHNASKYNVTGDLTFTQSTEDSQVTISGTIAGLTQGLHGFHIHEKGDLTDGCTSAGAHFNPDSVAHGAPDDEIRHVGDLGNIDANESGIAIVSISDSIISLYGSNSILGRAVVVHAEEDDLGLGNHTLSLTTGNAGDRAACGVIGVRSPTGRWAESGATMFSFSPIFLLASGIVLLRELKF